MPACSISFATAGSREFADELRADCPARIDATSRGPIGLAVGDRAVHVGSRKALAVLAVTALDGGATRDKLAFWLRPDADAASARRNLRRELFCLREIGVPLHDGADGALALAASLPVDARQLLDEAVLPDAVVAALEGLDRVGGVDMITSAGVVSTLAGLADTSGNVDGTGSAARLNQPWGLGVNAASNVYVADSSNGAIRKVTPAGVVTTVAQ